MKTKRKPVKRTAVTLMSALLLAVFAVSYLNWQWGRTVVTIDNESSHTIKNVKLFPGDGDYDINQISAGRSKLIRIFPNHVIYTLWVTFSSDQDHQTVKSPQMGVLTSENRYRLIIGKNGVMKWDTTGWLFTPPADNFDIFETVRKP